MPACWEIGPPEVLVATLTREIVTSAWALNYRNLKLPPTGDTTFVSGMPYDHARNAACDLMLAQGFTWLLFIDDDVIVPNDIFYRLSSHNKDIISGLYYRRHDPVAPVMIKMTPQGPGWVTSFTVGEIIEVDMVGAGCLLIHRRVLENMPSPWFEWWLDRTDKPPEEKLSEDFSFSLKARQLGYKIYVDTSSHCQHVGLGAASLGGSFTPLKL